MRRHGQLAYLERGERSWGTWSGKAIIVTGLLKVFLGAHLEIAVLFNVTQLSAESQDGRRVEARVERQNACLPRHNFGAWSRDKVRLTYVKPFPTTSSSRLLHHCRIAISCCLDDNFFQPAKVYLTEYMLITITICASPSHQITAVKNSFPRCRRVLGIGIRRGQNDQISSQSAATVFQPSPSPKAQFGDYFRISISRPPMIDAVLLVSPASTRSAKATRSDHDICIPG